MRIRTLSLAFVTCARLCAESGNASIRFTGAPSDGGQNCASCHSTFAPNSDARGSLTIDAGPYNPGVTQTIHVTIQHPQASRWGFQLTARFVSDETKEAGTFSPASTSVQVRCDDGSRFGAPGPCSGAREFAEHSMAQVTALGSGFTFDITWSPPANESGDVHLYAAAVAANGDGAPAGDWVYTTVKTVPSTGACSLKPKPTLRTAVNGASFQPAFSSKSMLSIFGTGFQVPGNSRQAGTGDIVNGIFPKQLACVAVEINDQRVPISYVQQDQINVQAPTFQGTGPVKLVVVLNPGQLTELRSDIATLTAQQAVAPALFTLGATNSIAAEFANSATIVADPSLVPGARPARPGEVITLFGTGFGDTNPSYDAGQVATGIARVTNTPAVTVGGITLSSADVLYAGLSPGSISGLYQINVRLPATLPNGNVPVVVSIGGSQSQNGVTIPIGAP